ncbi:rhamnogalacturonan acetylesterase [Paenibacillus sp. CCS19]|uniref:rhamnogalacturonan acetylesterase n=1 Tax=Paenibacillus sp. CCS19 TaxID=3158387 RepID=UPI00256C90CE|nr:rhamnogalacturonan acetylesterase [Paenibacillus cellulosilyticus]GMK37097.1 rhamnogalacturonan acetylesterase [Paenibacillus cellulosilyticus]
MRMSWRLDFGDQAVEPVEGYTKVTPASSYNEEEGFGFEPGGIVNARIRGGASDPLGNDFVIPLDAVFRIDAPQGNYRVTLAAGDPATSTSTTVQAGNRRLMLDGAASARGFLQRHTFTVHVREGESLRLHFNGSVPRIAALDIEPTEQAVTIFLAGDSTVTDQTTAPYAGWGQMLPSLFKADVAVANEAMSGRSSKSFIGEGRLAAIAERIRPNDFLFIQFGHNDQKPDEERSTSPFTTYKQYLTAYIKLAREKGAHPVLITPVQRRLFLPSGKLADSHGDYIPAMKQLAAELEVPLLDLAEATKSLYETLGVEPSKALFMWTHPGEFEAFPEGVQDNTHFQEFGGKAIAGLVADLIREQQLAPLSMFLR